MFINSLRRKVFGTNSLPKMLFGGHGPAPTGRLMAADKIIWIHVLTTEKEFMKVAAYEGESLQKALTRGQVPGFPASCQGGDPESTSHERPFDYYSRGPT